jgi:hypothetical protein
MYTSILPFQHPKVKLFCQFFRPSDDRILYTYISRTLFAVYHSKVRIRVPLPYICIYWRSLHNGHKFSGSFAESDRPTFRYIKPQFTFEYV